MGGPGSGRWYRWQGGKDREEVVSSLREALAQAKRALEGLRPRIETDVTAHRVSRELMGLIELSKGSLRQAAPAVRDGGRRRLPR